MQGTQKSTKKKDRKEAPRVRACHPRIVPHRKLTNTQQSAAQKFELLKNRIAQLILSQQLSYYHIACFRK